MVSKIHLQNITAVLVRTIIAVLFYTFSVEAQSDSLTIRLNNHVNKLCKTPKARNFKNIEALNQAGQYIISELTSVGYQTEKQDFLVEGNNYYNVICRYGDTTLPRFIIGAHYDVCGEQQGADDNASGVAGLLELAKLFKSEKKAINYCLEMVFYTLEEPPYFRTQQMGSYVHAKSIYDSKKTCIGMASIEMIGYFSDERKSQDYPIKLLKLFYPSKGNYMAVVAKSGNKKLCKKFKKGIAGNSETKTKKLIAPAKLQGVDFSDHLNYWFFGFKAIMITDTAFLRNKNYHKKSDTPETLNYIKMAEVVKGIYGTLLSLK